jgi:hypothetical protein
VGFLVVVVGFLVLTLAIVELAVVGLRGVGLAAAGFAVVGLVVCIEQDVRFAVMVMGVAPFNLIM